MERRESKYSDKNKDKGINISNKNTSDESRRSKSLETIKEISDEPSSKDEPKSLEQEIKEVTRALEKIQLCNLYADVYKGFIPDPNYIPPDPEEITSVTGNQQLQVYSTSKLVEEKIEDEKVKNGVNCYVQKSLGMFNDKKSENIKDTKEENRSNQVPVEQHEEMVDDKKLNEVKKA